MDRTSLNDQLFVRLVLLGRGFSPERNRSCVVLQLSAHGDGFGGRAACHR